MTEADKIQHEKPVYRITVNDIPKFDLSSYVSNYQGRTVFRRLYLLASCSTAFREEAARWAIQEARKGPDVNNYHDAFQLLQSVTGNKEPKDGLDTNWVTQQEKKNAAETKRLENELKQYKNNLIRESIRMGNEDLGSHYHAIGDLLNAVKAYSRMRDYCTTPSHIASTAFRIISVAIEQGNWLAVQSQVTKIRSLQMKPEESLRIQPKISAALGLQYMAQGEFREAALAFTSTDPSLGDTYNEVLTSNDVAVYGGLCALASMSRSELQSKILEKDTFRNFLELEPHIRRAINYFCASKYSQCLEILESYRADYLLDIYLQDQLPAIYQLIRTKSIVQYFQPFSRVTLESMQKMFGTPTTQVGSNATSDTPFEDELISMIEDGKLNARIDLENRVLIAYEEDSRAVMQRKALDTVDKFICEARLKLLRLNAINAGLEVKAPDKSKKESGTGSIDIESLIVDNGAGSGSGTQPRFTGPGTGNILNNGGHFQGTGYSLRSGKSGA